MSKADNGVFDKFQKVVFFFGQKCIFHQKIENLFFSSKCCPFSLMKPDLKSVRFIMRYILSNFFLYGGYIKEILTKC